MKTRTRRLLFTLFVFLFLFFASSIIAFSLGWRYNFETYGFEQIGGVSIKTQPRNVVINLNNKIYPDKSSIIQSETLISNLLPGNYKLNISKDGYYDYQKNLTIEPKMVEEVLSVMLVPKKINTEEVRNVKGDSLTAVSIDENNFIIQGGQNYYFYNLANASSTLNISASYREAQKTNIKNIAFSPFDANQLIIDDGKGLKLFNVQNSSVETITGGPVPAWSLNGSNIIYIKSLPKNTTAKTKIYGIFSYSFVFKNESLVIELPDYISPLNIETVKATSDNFYGILEKTGGLYLYKKDIFPFKKLSPNASALDMSSDSKMLSYSQNGSLNIFFLSDVNNNIRKKRGDEITIPLNISDEISKISWNKEFFHMLIYSSNAIYLAEIDDRIPQNIYPITLTQGGWIYSSKNDILYIIKNGSLSKIDFSKF